MVVEGFLGVLVSFLETLTAGLPTVDVPAWLTGLGAGVSSIMSNAGALSYWLPFSVAIPVAVAWLACLGVAWALKVTRIVVSLLTAGGGSAG